MQNNNLRESRFESLSFAPIATQTLLRYNQLNSKGVFPMPHVSPKQQLSPSDVRTIRSLLDQGESQVSLAKRYNVSRSAINHIHKGRTWGGEDARKPEPMHPSVREYKLNKVVDQWTDQLQRNPDKIRTLLEKITASWPDHKVDTLYRRLVNSTRGED